MLKGREPTCIVKLLFCDISILASTAGLRSSFTHVQLIMFTYSSAWHTRIPPPSLPPPLS